MKTNGPEPDHTLPSRSPGSTARRRWLLPVRLLLGFVGLLSVLLLGVWLARHEIVERLAVIALEREGLAPASLTVEEIGLTDARVTAVSIGPGRGLRAVSVEFDYSLDSLLAGEVEAVRVETLRAHGLVGEFGAVSIPALDPVLGVGSGGPPVVPALPAARIDIRDFALSLETPEGPAVIAGDSTMRRIGPDAVAFTVELSDLHTEWDERILLRGTARRADGIGVGLDGGLEATIVAPGFTISAEAKLSAVLAETELTAKASVSRLDFDAPSFHAQGMTGEAAYEDKDGELESLSIALDMPTARLLGEDIGPGRIEARRDGTQIAVTAVLDSDVGHFSLDAEGDPEDPAKPLGFTLNGIMDPRLPAALLGATEAPDGDIRLDVTGSLAAPSALLTGAAPNLAILLQALNLEANLESAVDGFTLPGSLRASGLAGNARLSVSENGAVLTLFPEFGLTGLAFEPGLIASLPPDLAEALNPGGARDFAVDGTAPLRLTLVPRTTGYAITISGALSGRGAEPDLNLAADGSLLLARDYTLRSVVARFVEAKLQGFRYDDLAGDLEARLTDLKGAPEVFGGTMALRLRGDVQGASSVTLRAADLELDGPFNYANETVSLTPGRGSRLTVTGLRVDGEPIGATPIALGIRPGRGSTVTLHTGAQPDLDYDLDLTLAALNFHLTGQDGPTLLGLGPSAVRVSGNTEALTLDWSSAGLAIGDQSVAVEGLKLDAALHGLGGGLRGTARLGGTVRDMADEPFVLPLALALDARLAAGILTATAKLSDSGARIVVTGVVRHSLASDAGEATFEAERIDFIESVLQPQDLFPALADVKARVDGFLDMSGAAAWAGEEFNAGMELALDLRSFVSPEAILKDIAGVVVFDSLFPLTTPPDQVVVFGYADIGVPLESGQVIFRLNPGPIIRAEAKDFDLYGGRIFVDPLDYDPAAEEISLVLGATGVRIKDMLAPARLGTLEATGALDGRLPIVIRGGEVAISGGVFESPEGGSIRYIPEDVGDAVREVDEATGLFLDAVSDFRYDRFRVTIDEGEDDEMLLGIEIEGHNPAVYEGVPIELNIAISGQVREVLYSGISTYELPERIAEALERFRE